MATKYPRRRPTVVDLFCGAGGMSLGFEQAGFDVVLGVDFDGHHVAAHHRNFPQGRSLCASVADLDATKIRRAAGVEEIDLVVGGPPCQGFSNMGHRDVADPRNTLIGEFARIVLELRPRAFVMENVPAMLAGDTLPLLDRVLEQLERGGYRITRPLRILTASDLGVPQVRSRLFVLGTRSDVAVQIEYPVGPCPGQPTRPTVLEAIADLPDVDNDPELFKRDYTFYDKLPKSMYARAARGEWRDPSDLSRPRVWPTDRCTGCTRIAHAPKSVALYAATLPGGTAPGHKLPRLDPNGLSPTLRAGSDSTRGSYTAPRPIHPLLPRCITAREAARLHGYPDWFSFYPTKWHAYKQIGNSVCPPVARAVGREVLKALGVQWTTRQPAAIRLDDNFPLAEDRPRQKARIPQVREYPPVIASIFESRYDRAKRALTKTRFTFADVTAAVKATGANLHWTRADTFVDEIARSRNVSKLLSIPLAHGFTIRKLATGPWIGEFVPVGTPGTVEQRVEGSVRVSDLEGTMRIVHDRSAIKNLAANLNSLLGHPIVREAIWGHRVSELAVASDVEYAASPSRRLFLTSPKGVTRQASALACLRENIPNRARIERVAMRWGVPEVIAATPLTSAHILISRFTVNEGMAKEASRRVFELVDPVLAPEAVELVLFPE